MKVKLQDILTFVANFTLSTNTKIHLEWLEGRVPACLP